MATSFEAGTFLLCPKQPAAERERYETLSVVWQPRHTIVHNVGVITQSDAIKLRLLVRGPVPQMQVRSPTRDNIRHLKRFLDKTVVPDRSIREAQGGVPFRQVPDGMMRAGWKARLARVRAARGVRLQAGADSLMTGTFFGPSLHRELEHFVEAGLSPLEAIRMATADAADTVGDLGSVEAGKLADLVLLDADPLDKVRNTRTIWRVIKPGQMFDPRGLRPGGPPGGEAKGAFQGR